MQSNDVLTSTPYNSVFKSGFSVLTKFITFITSGHVGQDLVSKSPPALNTNVADNSAWKDKSYISKLEKDLKDVRFSTLQRIITEGLGGHLEISIKF